MVVSPKPRVVLKLTGSALADNERRSAITQAGASFTAQQIRPCADSTELIVIIGGGNILRGRDFPSDNGSFQRNIDRMGMVATILNGLVLAEVLSQMGVPTLVLNKLEASLPDLPCYQSRVAQRACQEGRVVILVGGTGRSGVSTDTAAVRVAAECGAREIFKGTNVNGVFPEDPAKRPGLTHYTQLTVEEFRERGIHSVFDDNALDELRANDLRLRIFNWFSGDSLAALLRGEARGTVIA